jgi:hypothetical protein
MPFHNHLLVAHWLQEHQDHVHDNNLIRRRSIVWPLLIWLPDRRSRRFTDALDTPQND